MKTKCREAKLCVPQCVKSGVRGDVAVAEAGAGGRVDRRVSISDY
jgi:hypothetical protein